MFIALLLQSSEVQMNLAFEVISLHDVDTSLSNTVLVKTIYLFIYLFATHNELQTEY